MIINKAMSHWSKGETYTHLFVLPPDYSLLPDEIAVEKCFLTVQLRLPSAYRSMQNKVVNKSICDKSAIDHIGVFK